jgi:hypothetical protein
MNACCTIPVITLLLQGDGPIHLQQPIRYNRLTNVDGYQFFCRRVSGKAVGIVARAGARGTCVALLDPSAGQITETTLGDVEAAARPKGLQIQVLNVQTSRDINAAFTTFMRERPDAFFVGPGPFFTSRRVQLALLAAPRYISGAKLHNHFCPACGSTRSAGLSIYVQISLVLRVGASTTGISRPRWRRSGRKRCALRQYCQRAFSISCALDRFRARVKRSPTPTK